MQQAELPLRDIHAAPPPAWWPPAWGWWFLAALLVIAVVWIVIHGRRLLARRRYQRQLLSEVDHVLHQWQANRDDHQAIAALSVLLRRLVVHAGDQPRLAGVAGDAWVMELKRAVDQQPELMAAAEALASAPYQANPKAPDIPAMARLAHHWVLQVSRV